MPSIHGQLYKYTSRYLNFIEERNKQQRLAKYISSDRIPWQTGYHEYRVEYLANVLSDEEMLSLFNDDKRLPEGYGYRLDARVVEIPWVLSRLDKSIVKILDAGSSLNHDFILTAPPLDGKRIAITTLAPEAECYWRLNISYVYDDLRDLVFKSDSFDAVICISTIEHVGMNNSMYTSSNDTYIENNPNDFLLAIDEITRVVKPEGVVYFTFPYGVYEDHNWFQQFDAHKLQMVVDRFSPRDLIKAFYKYLPGGWQLSTQEECDQCEFFDVHQSKYFNQNSDLDFPPDFPAGERAVACLQMMK